MLINGLWGGRDNDSDTFTRFFYLDGQFIGQDLSTLPGSFVTPDRNQGRPINGTANETVAYNNIAGTSYQFCANNSLGSSCGATLFSPPGQIQNISAPSLVGFDHNEDSFDLSVSQAQCSGDLTSFSIDLSDSIDSDDIVNVTIFDSTDGTALQVIPRADMHENGNTSFFFEFLLATGGYHVLALTDQVGIINTRDFFDSAAVNVPLGDCFTPSDLTTLLSNNANQSVVLINEINNINATGGGGLLGLGAFTGYTLGDSTVMVALFVLMLFFMWRGLWFATFGPLVGLITVLVEGVDPNTDFMPWAPLTFLISMAFTILGLWLEVFAGGFKRLKSSD